MVKRSPHNVLHLAVVKRSPHNVLHLAVVKRSPHNVLHLAVVKRSPHNVLHLAVVKRSPHSVSSRSKVTMSEVTQPQHQNGGGRTRFGTRSLIRRFHLVGTTTGDIVTGHKPYVYERLPPAPLRFCEPDFHSRPHNELPSANWQTEMCHRKSVRCRIINSVWSVGTGQWAVC